MVSNVMLRMGEGALTKATRLYCIIKAKALFEKSLHVNGVRQAQYVCRK